METRNNIEILINQFLACTTNPFEFIEDLLYDLDTFEKKENLICDFKRFLTSDKLDSALQSFYENQLRSIPVDASLITNNELTTFAHLEEIEILQVEAFNKRQNELSLITDKVLDDILKSFRNIENKKQPIVIKGLNYQGKAKGQLEDFFNSLIRYKYIDEMKYAEFSKFFMKQFEPNEYKILWRSNLNDLYFLFRKIVDDKINFHFSRNNYREIIPFMFLWENEIREIVSLTPKQFSMNNKAPKDIKFLETAFNHLL